MKTKIIIGLIIVLVFAVWGVTAFLDTTIKYVTFAEAKAAQKTVQVAGKIDFGSINYDNQKGCLTFTMIDMKNPDTLSAERMEIIYYGVVPSNFDHATSVLVRGKPSSDGFIAEQLLVKCPSKYQGLEDNT